MLRTVEWGGICGERERLLSKAAVAVNEHSKKSTALAEAVGMGNGNFQELRGGVQVASGDAQAAIDAYKRHVAAHGC